MPISSPVENGTVQLPLDYGPSYFFSKLEKAVDMKNENEIVTSP